MLDGASVTHTEFLEKVEAYALAALEPDEARAVAAHVRDAGPHPECEAALRRAERTVAELSSEVAPVTPPARVWSSIAASIAPQQKGPRTPGWAYGFAAAALLLLALGGLFVRRVQTSAEQATAAAAQCARELTDARIDVLRKEDALRLLVEPGTQLVSLRPAAPGGPAPQGTGVVLFNPRGRALFIGQRFAADPTRDYELWLIRDGRPLAAGILPLGPEGQALADIRSELLSGSRPSGFAVSIEKKGGELDGPRGPVILSGALGAP
jgi:anti-sigma-K factor RskA